MCLGGGSPFVSAVGVGGGGLVQAFSFYRCCSLEGGGGGAGFFLLSLL